MMGWGGGFADGGGLGWVGSLVDAASLGSKMWGGVLLIG